MDMPLYARVGGMLAAIGKYLAVIFSYSMIFGKTNSKKIW
jgi:hypothetical protein